MPLREGDFLDIYSGQLETRGFEQEYRNTFYLLILFHISIMEKLAADTDAGQRSGFSSIWTLHFRTLVRLFDF